MTILRRIAIVVVALAAIVLLLNRVFGMHLQMDGQGSLPKIAFHNESAHIDRLEEHRASQDRDAVAEPLADTPPEPEPIEAEGVLITPGDILEQQDLAAADEETDASLDGDGTAAAIAAPASVPPGWTHYRGDDGSGIYREPIRIDWLSAEPELLYKQPVGLGHASFVVSGSRAVTIEQRRDEEVVAAYDVRSGVELWATAWPARFSEMLGGDGPRATPAIAEGRVVALGATGVLKTLSLDSGDVLWERNILQDSGAGNIEWGMSSSPLIDGDRVYTVPGGDGSAVIVYSLATGDVLLKALRGRAAYTAPQLLEIGGLRQLVVVLSNRVVGADPQTGAELWSFPWATYNGINAAQAIVIDDSRVFLSAGYDHGAALWQISENGGTWSAEEVWHNNQMKNKFSSSVLFEGHIYGLDEGILACIDPLTGKRLWKGGRYGHGQLLLASGHLVVLTEKGDVALVVASPEGYEEVAKIPAIRGRTWNVPALDDGVLLVRNGKEMAAFDIGT